MNGFVVWVDGDSCPRRIREIVVRAAERRRVRVVFVSDRRLPVRTGPYVEVILVDSRGGAVDDRIAESVRLGDLVVTRDVGLSARVAGAGAVAVDDRGNRYTAENVGERYSVHLFMAGLRKHGIDTSGGARRAKNSTADFAATFDRELTSRIASRRDPDNPSG